MAPLLVLVKLPLPAVACPRKVIDPLAAVIKFCATPELFVMPEPSNSNCRKPKFSGGARVIVNGLAPALKVMPFTLVSAEREIAVLLLVANVAVLAGASGMVAGVQLAAWFQLPVGGDASQVALPAKAELGDENSGNKIAAIRRNNGDRSRGSEGGASRIDGTMFVMLFIYFSLVRYEGLWHYR